MRLTITHRNNNGALRVTISDAAGRRLDLSVEAWRRAVDAAYGSISHAAETLLAEYCGGAR